MHVPRRLPVIAWEQVTRLSHRLDAGDELVVAAGPVEAQMLDRHRRDFPFGALDRRRNTEVLEELHEAGVGRELLTGCGACVPRRRRAGLPNALETLYRLRERLVVRVEDRQVRAQAAV